MNQMDQLAVGSLKRAWTESFGRLTFLRLSLLWLALGSVGFGLAAMVKYLQPGLMFWTGFFGVLTGWLLPRSRRSGWKSVLTATGVGLLWLLIVVGRLNRPLGALVSAFSDLIVQINLKQAPFSSIDASPLLEAWRESTAACLTLFSRTGNWVQGIAAGNVIIDPIVTALLWGALIWIAAAWAGWFMRRKGSVFVALLPASVLLAYNAFYTNSRASLIWLIFLCGALVLLQAVNGYLSARDRWQAAHMHRAGLETSLTVVVLGVTFFLMLAGGLSPSISVIEIKNTVSRLLEANEEQQLAKALNLQVTPGSENGGSNVAVGLPNLPAQHRVGPGPIVLHDVVMYASIEGYEAAPPEALQAIPDWVPSVTQYRYWRGQTYETYTGYGWSTRTVSESDYPANASLLQPDEPLSEDYQVVSQHIQRVADDNGALFFIGDLVSADQPYQVDWRGTEDLINAHTEAASYDAESRVLDVTVDQLRSAGMDYPAAIRSRYLQLPRNLPQRVRSLALDLTASQLTPYDQVAAIQAYLRTFPYDLDVPAPPVTRDVADFFLFDLQKGYCDYYATTMAVMARAVGIPSRLVIGFASGDYDEQSGQFVITLADTHAWVEIYFPGYGWVEFEPTTGLPPIERPGSQSTPDAAPSSAPIIETRSEMGGSGLDTAWLRGLFNARTFAVLAAILAVILLALFLPVERWILLSRPAEAAVTAIYRRLYRQGRRWGIQADASRTPHEFAATLASRVEKPSANARLSSALHAPLRAELNWLTGLYARSLYSPFPPTREEQDQAVRTWERLRQRLLRLYRRR